MNLNKALIFGNLTRDPELRALPSGMNVASFSVATSRTYKDRDGKRQEQTDFHNVVVFGRQADAVAQYLKKGRSVFVEGRMQTRSWEGKDGEKKYRTEIVADRVQFGPGGPREGGGRSGGGGQGGGQGDAAPAEEMSSGGAGGSGIEYPKDDINPDDIPF